MRNHHGRLGLPQGSDDLTQRREHPVDYLLSRLGTRNSPRDVSSSPGRASLRETQGELRDRESRPLTDVELAQSGIEADREADYGSNR